MVGNWRNKLSYHLSSSQVQTWAVSCLRLLIPSKCMVSGRARKLDHSWGAFRSQLPLFLKGIFKSFRKKQTSGGHWCPLITVPQGNRSLLYLYWISRAQLYANAVWECEENTGIRQCPPPYNLSSSRPLKYPCLFCWKNLAAYLTLPSNSKSSCLSFLTTGIIGVLHQFARVFI